MRFEEIIKELRDGKKFRRKDWNKNDYIYIKGECISYSGHAYCLNWGILLDNNWELYEEPILDKEEKEYLSAVIKPFKDKISKISKTSSYDYEYLYFVGKVLKGSFRLPSFAKGTMYKGMKLGKKYTLKELGL